MSMALALLNPSHTQHPLTFSFFLPRGHKGPWDCWPEGGEPAERTFFTLTALENWAVQPDEGAGGHHPSAAVCAFPFQLVLPPWQSSAWIWLQAFLSSWCLLQCLQGCQLQWMSGCKPSRARASLCLQLEPRGLERLSHAWSSCLAAPWH